MIFIFIIYVYIYILYMYIYHICIYYILYIYMYRERVKVPLLCQWKWITTNHEQNDQIAYKQYSTYEKPTNTLSNNRNFAKGFYAFPSDVRHCYIGVQKIQLYWQKFDLNNKNKNSSQIREALPKVRFLCPPIRSCLIDNKRGGHL